MLTSTDPASALRKLLTSKPSRNDATKRKIPALMTKIKRPRVSTVTGKVRTMRIGRRTALKRPRKNAAIIAGNQPVTVIPGIICVTARSARAVIRRRIKNFIPSVYTSLGFCEHDRYRPLKVLPISSRIVHV